MKRSTETDLIIAIIAISFAALFFRNAESVHPLVAAGIRLSIAALLLWPFTARQIFKSSRQFILTGILCGFFYAIHFGAWVWSLDLTSVAASVTLVTATPLFLAVAGLISGRDRPNSSLWLCLSLGAVGVGVIGFADFNHSEGNWIGDLLALVGCLGMAAYMLAVRRLGSFPIWPFITIAASVGACILLSVAAMKNLPIIPPRTTDLGWLLLAALVPQLIGHTLLTAALRKATPTQVGLVTIGEPVGATIIAWIWLNEIPSWGVILGSSITLCALVIAMKTMQPLSTESNQIETRS